MGNRVEQAVNLALDSAFLEADAPLIARLAGTSSAGRGVA